MKFIQLWNSALVIINIFFKPMSADRTVHAIARNSIVYNTDDRSRTNIRWGTQTIGRHHSNSTANTVNCQSYWPIWCQTLRSFDIPDDRHCANKSCYGTAYSNYLLQPPLNLRQTQQPPSPGQCVEQLYTWIIFFF